MKSIHDTKLIVPADQKYAITDAIPKLAKDPHPMSPTCPTSYLFQLTKTWDKGSKRTRERLLKEFVNSMSNLTGPALEKELNNGASLFLTRISAWLRLTYLLGYDLALQLSAITVFISAASGHRFLTEFLEVGGILTVLDILTISQAREADLTAALNLLMKVALNGRKYKEFICESYGVRQVTDCLSRSKSEITQDYAKNLLICLGTGNPRFQIQVFKGLQSLLSSPAVAPSSQQMASQALRQLLKITDSVPATLVDPASSLLRSQHIQVQYEGYELLRELVKRPSFQDQVVTVLVAVLRCVYESNVSEESKLEKDKHWNANKVEDQKERERIMSGQIQQAYAAKLVGILFASDPEVSDKLIRAQVVSGLLNVIGNIGNYESQKYAVENILFLVNSYPEIAQIIRDSMGENFYDLLENKADTFAKELTKEQVRYLRRNQVRIRFLGSGGRDREDSVGPEDGKKSTTSFPAAFQMDSKEEEVNSAPFEKEVTPEAQSKPQTQANVETKQNPEILPTKGGVDEVFEQFQDGVGITATFPVKKYEVGGEQADRENFDKEFTEFRSKSKTRQFKKPYDPELGEDVTEQLSALRTDESLFSHESMIAKIELHFKETEAGQTLSNEDQAMLSLAKPVIQERAENEETEDPGMIEEKPTVDEIDDEIKKKLLLRAELKKSQFNINQESPPMPQPN